jgi:hypothetical protein
VKALTACPLPRLSALPCLQDIGESETHELDGLYKPLLQGLLAAVLTQADLSNQGVPQEGLDLKQLVSTMDKQQCVVVYTLAASVLL